MSTRPWNFLYDNGQYLTFDLTEEDERALMKNLIDGTHVFCFLSFGAISTKGLRCAVIKVEEEPEELESAVPPEYEMQEFIYEKQTTREEDVDDDE